MDRSVWFRNRSCGHSGTVHSTVPVMTQTKNKEVSWLLAFPLHACHTITGCTLNKCFLKKLHWLLVFFSFHINWHAVEQVVG